MEPDKKKRKKREDTEDDMKVFETSIPSLLQSYGATMSPEDRKILRKLRSYSSAGIGTTIETLPLFGPKSKEKPAPGASNPLYAHSTRANTILVSINDVKAYHTALLYDPQKKATTSASYDLRFLLPIICHVLDEKNICDGGKVIANGWIYLIVRGMALEDEMLRAQAFQAFDRLIVNLQQAKKFRSQDVKIWLHFLNGVKRGIVQLGECKISHLLATWMVAAWEAVRQPSNSMFRRVTTFLFAKPVIEMSILPDFIAFFNDGDDNKESRIWILNVLYHGLKTKEDWKIAQKLPTIKFLCCSFILEKVKTQRTIVGILSHGATIPEVAEEMTDKYSIPFWLANLTTTSQSLKNDLERFFQRLVSSTPETETRSKIFHFVSQRQKWSLTQDLTLPNTEDADEEEDGDNVDEGVSMDME